MFSRHAPKQVFNKYKLVTEWTSLNKKHEIRFIAVLEFTDYGELSFHSLFNPDMFLGSVCTCKL